MSLLVTVLTGRRPHLLERTLTSVESHHPALAEAWWLVCHNGGDPATSDVLVQHKDLVDQLVVTPSFLDVGPAVSFLFNHALETNLSMVLHLEDDWEAGPGDWLTTATGLLAEGVFQIRLRHHEEPVLSKHMVTNRPLIWEAWPDFRYSRDAHYTLNPSLIMTQNLRYGFPATTEREAQRRFWMAKKRSVAQLIPGVWRHIGGGTESLRQAR